MIYKTLQRKPKIEQHEHLSSPGLWGLCSGAPEFSWFVRYVFRSTWVLLVCGVCVAQSLVFFVVFCRSLLRPGTQTPQTRRTQMLRNTNPTNQGNSGAPEHKPHKPRELRCSGRISSVCSTPQWSTMKGVIILVVRWNVPTTYKPFKRHHKFR
jgi:hypothetical protein